MDAWTDSWLLRDTTRLPSTPQGTNPISKVKNIFLPRSIWNEDAELIQSLHNEEDAKCILAIPARGESGYAGMAFYKQGISLSDRRTECLPMMGS